LSFLVVALVACDGESPAPTPGSARTTPARESTPTPASASPASGAHASPTRADPLLGGSARPGDGAGFAILDPHDSERPFFRDLGAIPRGETRVWSIRLLNQDPGPVAIKEASGSCGCVRVHTLRARTLAGEVIEGDNYAPAPPVLVVPAGATMELELVFDTERLQVNADKLAIFRIMTDSDASPYITFEAHLFVRDSFRVTPAELQFGHVPQGFGGRTKVRILAEPIGSPARILGIAEQGERVTAEVEDIFYGNEHVWHVLAEIPALEPIGAIRDRIVLQTTDELGEGDAGRLEVRVLATIVPDVRFEPPLVAFGARAGDAAAESSTTLEALVPGARMRVIGHRFEGASAAFLEAEQETLDADETGRSNRARLRVRLKPGHPAGMIAARLFVETDDPQNPTASVPVSGVIR